MFATASLTEIFDASAAFLRSVYTMFRLSPCVSWGSPHPHDMHIRLSSSRGDSLYRMASQPTRIQTRWSCLGFEVASELVRPLPISSNAASASAWDALCPARAELLHFHLLRTSTASTASASSGGTRDADVRRAAGRLRGGS